MHTCPTDIDPLTAAHRAARRCKRAHARAESARIERDALVVHAYAHGTPLATIAATTGMSVSRIAQIVNAARQEVRV